MQPLGFLSKYGWLELRAPQLEEHVDWDQVAQGASSRGRLRSRSNTGLSCPNSGEWRMNSTRISRLPLSESTILRDQHVDSPPVDADFLRAVLCGLSEETDDLFIGKSRFLHAHHSSEVEGLCANQLLRARGNR